MWDSTNPIPRGQNGNWIRTDVSVEGRLIATYDTAGGTPFAIAAGGADIDVGLHLHVTDALGTRRLQTDPWGWPEEACASGPFGDNLNCSTLANAPPSAEADAATPKHYTGKERDTESGNDYFGLAITLRRSAAG